MSSCTHGSDAVCSHASRRAAGGSTISPSRYASTSAAHFSCHSSLRTCLPCVAARRSVSPPQTRSLPLPLAAVAYLPPPGHAGIPDVERRTAGARPSTYGILRHSIPQNDKFKVGSAPGINAPYSVILRPQAEESRPSARRAPLIRGAGSSRLARVYCRSVFPPSRYASTSAARSSCHSSLREIPPCTHGSDAGSSRLARVCRRSTSAATQHVRPALRADCPRFAPHMSPCTGPSSFHSSG